MAVDLRARINDEMKQLPQGIRHRASLSVKEWLKRDPRTLQPEPRWHRRAEVIDFSIYPRQVQLEATFATLVQQWRRETALSSIIGKKVMHRAYQRIIAMGPMAIPLILRELEERPDHWFWALSVLTDENPAESAADFNEAREAWLRWGRERGYIR
jgi:hypothetical protein